MTGIGRRWTGATAMTVLAATLAGAVPCRAARAHANRSQEVAEVARQDLARLSARLNDPSSPQELRDDAARRLIARRTPDARRIVADALVNLNVGGQLAAARALADDPDPDPALINPLFAILGTNRQLTEAAAHALAAYKTNPEVTARLVGFAQRPAASEGNRVVVIRVIGSIPDKRAAEFLVGVVQNPGESAAARGAAAEALVELTGHVEFGDDASRWSGWWDENAAKGEERFRADLLPRRATRADRVERRVDSLAAALRAIVNEQYRAAPAAQRPDLLLKHLRADEPQLRAVAAGIVYDEARDGRPPRADVRDQLREMIGDSDAGVRAVVAEAFATINDAASFDALLAQLAQETDAPVRASLARALAPIKDLRAVPVLIAMLSDRSHDVAAAAAAALRSMGKEIREHDPALAQRTALALRDALERRTAAAAPQTAALRETIVGAMGPLRQPDLLQIFIGMLDGRRGESVEVRVLAIKAIGELANSDSAGVLIAQLDDRESRIRLEAVRALQLNPALAEMAEALRDRRDPQREPDEQVRKAADLALDTVFPHLPKEQLQIWADRFKGNPERRRLVLVALRDQQIRDRDEDGLATTRETLGQVEMELKNYKDAAREFGLALDYKKTQPVPDAVKVTLMSARMRALLLDKDFPAAITFAQQMIQEDPGHAQTFGTLIWNEAQRLRDAGDTQAALDLIAATKAMDPPLSDKYRDELASIEKEITTKRNQQNGANPPPGPRSAEAPAANAARTSAGN